MHRCGLIHLKNCPPSARYKPFLVAEVAADSASLSVAEDTLREYLQGQNSTKESISRTTPLFREQLGNIFFMLPGYQVCDTLKPAGFVPDTIWFSNL